MAGRGNGRAVKSWSELLIAACVMKLTLSSVRLVLALLKTLGTHGWILTNSVQAAGLQVGSRPHYGPKHS